VSACQKIAESAHNQDSLLLQRSVFVGSVMLAYLLQSPFFVQLVMPAYLLQSPFFVGNADISAAEFIFC
jgi:hypothetical protein